MEITAEHFQKRMGVPPRQDDLERCNCNKTGELGHTQCGWDNEFDLPIFVVGRYEGQREYFRQHLLHQYPEKE